MNPQNLNSAIRDIRVGMGLSQTETAFKIGITQSHYSKYERGEACIGDKSQNHLFELFQLKVVSKKMEQLNNQPNHLATILKEQHEEVELHLNLVDKLIQKIKKLNRAKNLSQSSSMPFFP